MQYYKYKEKPVVLNDIKIGDVVTLNNGMRGKVSAKSRYGYSMKCGKRGKLYDFYAGVVTKIERCRVSRVRIHQIDPLDSEYAFRDYKNVRAHGRAAPPPELYTIVFDGQLDTDNLNEITRIFNVAHPHEYRGRFLTTSDIVELYDAGGSRFFYCDTFGYKKIRFSPVKCWFMLISYNERDLQTPQLFPSLPQAQDRMRAELLDKLYGSFEEYDKGEDYGLDSIWAWSNPGSNWDWRIIRITANHARKIKASFLFEE